MASQFGFGVAVGYHRGGSGRPMAWAILATTAASLAGYLLFRRSQR